MGRPRRWIRYAGVRAARALAPLLALAGLLAACESPFSSEVRRHTYPPEFNYISSEQLDSAMEQLAAEVTQLDRVLRAPGGPGAPGEARRREAIAILARMEQVGESLGGQAWPSNHPRVARNVGSFVRDVAAARRALELEPPSDYLAGTVSGACMHCHGSE